MPFEITYRPDDHEPEGVSVRRVIAMAENAGVNVLVDAPDATFTVYPEDIDNSVYSRWEKARKEHEEMMEKLRAGVTITSDIAGIVQAADEYRSRRGPGIKSEILTTHQQIVEQTLDKILDELRIMNRPLDPAEFVSGELSETESDLVTPLNELVDSTRELVATLRKHGWR